MEITGTRALPKGPEHARIREVAEQLEGRFLAEMLRSAGLGESGRTFDGSVGEDQFTSFLVSEYADAVVARGGIGLSEAIFKSLLSDGGNS